ncbi:MAG: hypothetical protein ABIJ95_05225, partial [Pseudomonadota bacterium]
MADRNIPVVVGQGQYVQPMDEPRPLDPVGLMVRAGERALASAGPPELARAVDRVYVMNVLSHTYADMPGRLIKALGLSPKKAEYGVLGGNTPVKAVNQAARDIAAGRAECVLIAGGEADCAKRRAGKGQVALDWDPAEPPASMEGDDRLGSTDLENHYDWMAPAYTYAAFENAFRHSRGRSLEEHRRALGALCERMAAVAAQNPHAWNREGLSGREIITPMAKNRYVAYPYTIRMNPNIHVDLSACVILTSEKKARDLGVDPGAFVYPLGGAELDNVWEMCRRPRLFDSPAIGECGRLALAQAGLTINGMDLFDLYSCFTSVVQIAMAELGIPEDDPRPMTVTGGLPYFGGPGNNYGLHAIATLAEAIARGELDTGLTTGLGWFLHKHAVGIYGAEPPATDLASDLEDGESLLVGREPAAWIE